MSLRSIPGRFALPEAGSPYHVALPYCCTFFGLARWVGRLSVQEMEIGRKKLPHEMPPGVVPNPEVEVYFITLCCEPRGVNQLALPEVWEAIRVTIEVRQAAGDWRVSLMLAMPDHLHALISFPGRRPMEKVIGNRKAWLAKSQRIDWHKGRATRIR